MKDFTVKVNNLSDLVVAPHLDPFSDYEPTRSGEAALARAIREWDLSGRWSFNNIVIQMPSEKVQQLDNEKTHKMLHRYLENQLQENQENMIFFRRNLFRVFCNAFIFLAICMTIVSIVGNTAFLPSMPNIVRRALTEGFTIIGWVVLWRPIEFMLVQWGELRKQNIIYQMLKKAKLHLKEE